MPNILLIDANTETLEVFGELLELDGHRVRRARTGHEALAHMRARLAPLVIIDEDVSDFAGSDLSAHLKATAEVDWGRARCITIALRGDVDFLNPAKWPCFDHAMAKPVNFSQFYSLIEACAIELTGKPKLA